MAEFDNPKQERLAASLLADLPDPADAALQASREGVRRWFAQTANTIFWTQIDTPIGNLFVAANKKGLVRVSFGESTPSFLREFDPIARLRRDDDRIEPYRQQLQEYFLGQRRAFSLPTDLSDRTVFQRQVLRYIETIPAGQVRSYGQIAAAIDRPGSARAVGQALGSNPIPIVLPCHRIVASDGSLGGYRGGLERKRRLLLLEGALPRP
jgi:methylated-DNA-[protein]-cysteine S-methyltransferase